MMFRRKGTASRTNRRRYSSFDERLPGHVDRPYGDRNRASSPRACSSFNWNRVLRLSYLHLHLARASVTRMKVADNGISARLKNSNKALSRSPELKRLLADTRRRLDRQGMAYLQGIRGQTRGSHRVKRSNQLGLRLAESLKVLRGRPSEQLLEAYIEMAQRRTELAAQCLREGSTRDERIALIFSVLAREALSAALSLDEMESLQAILRIRRCPSCSSWFWGRVPGQRYCGRVCRMRHYRRSPEGKRYKREWARANYALNKKRDEAMRRATSKS